MLTRGQRDHVGWPAAVGVFAAVTAFVLWFYGNRPFFVFDEGILLESAQRMMQGQKLYVDFFGYMSPGSYWLQEAALRMFGVSLRSARLVMCLDFALQCSLVLWLTSRIASSAAAWAALVFFFAFQITQPSLLIPYHWWDSVTLSLASIAICLQGFWTRRRAWWIAGGALASAAVFSTPSIGLIAAVTASWLLLRRELRRFFWWYALSGVLVAALALGYMYATGILGGFFKQMAWLRTNYSEVNRAPYGAIIGGYPAVLRGVSGSALIFRLGFLFCLALPALLPIIAVAGYPAAAAARRGRGSPLPKDVPAGYLLLCLAAYIASAYPRLNVTHLAFVAPLGYVLVAALVYWNLRPGFRLAVLTLMLPWAAVLFAQAVAQHAVDQRIESPVGAMYAGKPEAGELRRLFLLVRPRDSLFIHPYLPLLYFVTQAQNPTRYSYLQPGMMTQTEERQALNDLERKPPKWILYLRMSRKRYLEIFPNAASHRFPTLEGWIERNYTLVEPPVVMEDYALWSKKPAHE